MTQPKQPKKSQDSDPQKSIPKNEIEQRWIEALYYIYNSGLPTIKDDLSYQKAREEFISQYPEFSDGIPEKFDPVRVKSIRNEALNILHKLPLEKRIWPEELAINTTESQDLAYKALNQIVPNLLGEEFPHPFKDEKSSKEAIKVFERLEKKFNELKANLQSMTLAERQNYGRSQEEAHHAWNIFLLNALQRSLFAEKITNPNEICCLFYELGKSVGLLKSLSEKQFSLMKEAAARVKSSEAVMDGRWKLKRAQKEEAKKIADNIWTKGDTALHTEMADYLYKNTKYQQLIGLSRKEILSAIKSVANKHNRLFGKKGVTKYK